MGKNYGEKGNAEFIFLSGLRIGQEEAKSLYKTALRLAQKG